MRPLLAPLLLTATLALGIPLFTPATPTRADRILASIDPLLLAHLPAAERLKFERYVHSLASGPAPAARCWAPGTDPLIVAAYHAAQEAARGQDPADDDGSPPQPATQLDSRWSITATDGSGQGDQGLPVTLTWSIVPDGTPIPGDPGIGDPTADSDLRAFLAGIYGGSATGPASAQPWFAHFQAIFDDVATQTGISYVYEDDDDGLTGPSPVNFTNAGILGVRGDIRIGGHYIDGDGPFGGTLAYNYFPNQGDMIIDTADDWFENNKANPTFIRNLLGHEHGHGLGLKHLCPLDNTKLMEGFINTNFDGMQFDDVYSLQRHYGDFYEKHSSARNNDTTVNAAAIAVSSSTPFAHQWLGIDDNTDTDFYRFSAPLGSGITVRVIPSTESYLEGPASVNCTGVSPFDSATIHNLALALIGPDQTTVLTSATGNPAGQSEEITAFVTPSAGFHYIKVTGDAANATQLYRLEVELTPPVDIRITASPIILESFSGNNGAADPGETIQVDITLANNGSVSATNVQATLTGPAGFTGFTSSGSYGNIDTGADNTASFVFALNGNCGDTIPLDLAVTADAGYMINLPLPITLGTLTDVLDQSFHDPTLPVNWTSTSAGVGTGWTPSNVEFNSAPRAAFAVNEADIGESTLTSPVVTLGSGTSTLSFANSYNTEANVSQAYDGGVLEISIAAGAWTDVIDAGGTFTSEGYNRTLRENFGNPLGGREAWSGNSGGFLTSTLTLPPAAANQSIQLRWRLGHDESQPDVGWSIDDVTLLTHTCDSSPPTLAFILDDATASEFAPLDLAGLTITAPLPPLNAVAITPTNTGTASTTLDVTGLDAIILPASQMSLPVTVQAVNDTTVEGDETLILTLPGAPGSATITIADTPYGQWAATEIGLGPLSAPLADFDHDSATNLAEYAHQTDPDSPNELPDLNPRLDGTFFRVDAPLASPPADVHIGAEASQNLQSWSSTSVQTLTDGFKIPAGDPLFFLRLTYELIPAAP